MKGGGGTRKEKNLKHKHKLPIENIYWSRSLDRFSYVYVCSTNFIHNWPSIVTSLYKTLNIEILCPNEENHW